MNALSADVRSWLDHNATVRGGAVALSDGRRSVTHAELRALAADAAAAVADLEPGSVVALSADASVEGVAALLGLLVSDIVVSPVNTRLTPGELASTSIGLTLPSWCPTRRTPPPGSPGRVAPLAGLFGELADTWTTPGAAPTATPTAAFPTGGTTGLPKAAVWGRIGLALAIASSVDNLDVSADDVELYLSPLFHVTIVPGFLATLAAGGGVILQQRLDAAAAAHLIVRREITRMFGTPTAITRILDNIAVPQAGNTMEMVYGAARSSEGFRSRLSQVLPDARVYTGYGRDRGRSGRSAQTRARTRRSVDGGTRGRPSRRRRDDHHPRPRRHAGRGGRAWRHRDPVAVRMPGVPRR